MSQILIKLNKYLGCLPIKTKSEKEYITEIFDGIDTDGNQYLDTDELQNIVEFIRNKRINIIKNDIAIYKEKKLEEIDRLKKNSIEVLIDNNQILDINNFTKIIKSLHLTQYELENLWKNIKRDEIISIENEINKLNNLT